LAQVEMTIHRVTVGLLRVPDGLDPGDHIVSGSILGAPSVMRVRRSAPPLADAVAEYLVFLGHVAESNRGTIAVHLRSLSRKLGIPHDQFSRLVR
jgi:hypothetical protein